MVRALWFTTSISVCFAGCLPVGSTPAEEDSPATVSNPFTAFEKLDNVEGDWVNLHPIPVRPMVWVDDEKGPHIYATNVHDDRVQHIDHTQTTVQSFRTLAAPVAIARWAWDDGGIDWLLVVAQHSDALVIHDRRSGDIVEIISVPAEPADIVVDPQGRAFISCMGEDAVVRVDLHNLSAPITRYRIDSRRPAFLSLAGDEVLVAPMLSGNNSLVEFIPTHLGRNPHAASEVIDLDRIQTNGLPDGDLFWIDQTSGVAVPVVTGAGTVLFAHGLHGDNEYWQLNIEQNNKDPNRQGDAAIRGEISFNRLSITQLPPLVPGTAPVPASRFVYLDDSDAAQSGIQYDRTKTIGMPYALVFSPSTGFAAVAGLLSSNVTILDPAGQPVVEWDLPKGCIPRQMLLDPQELVLFTYCSGTNTIHVDLLGLPPTPVADYDLGPDPRPDQARAGEIMFFNSEFSLHNNASCATCHIEGGLDLTTWNIGHVSKDDKGPLTTQSLLASNVTRPHHWRGEQLEGIADFRGVFTNLFGGADPGDTEFAALERFILSLEAPPNPYQHEDRVLDERIQPPAWLDPAGPLPVASVRNGQALFSAGCASGACHTLPLGSSHDIQNTGEGFHEVKPKRQRMKVPPFKTLLDRGLEPIVQVSLPGRGNLPYPRIGSGVAHAGNPRNILDFVRFFALSDQQKTDVTAFLHQLDTGLAPSTRAEVLMNAGTVTAADARVTQYLVPQARAGHCDVAVFGSTVIGGQRRIVGWAFDPAAGLFRRDDGVLQPVTFFAAQVAQSVDWFVFSGRPVGAARRWAIDFDDDDLENALEPPNGLYDPDTDGDGYYDGHEVRNGGNPIDASVGPSDVTPPVVGTHGAVPLWNTSKVGRINFASDELTTYSLSLAAAGLQPKVVVETQPRRTHSAVFSDLVPATSYTATLVVTDLGGLSVTINATFTTIGTADTMAVVANSLSFLNIDTTIPGQVRYTVAVNVADKSPGANLRGNQVVIARAIVNEVPAGGAGGPGLITMGPQDFCVDGIRYSQYPGSVPGPFIVSAPTNNNGDVTFQFTVTGVNQNDRLVLNLEAIARDAPLGTCPISGGHNSVTPAIFRPVGPVGFSFPDTKKNARSIAHVVP